MVVSCLKAGAKFPGTSIFGMDESNITALNYAAGNGNLACVERILQTANTTGRLPDIIDLADNQGKSPLFYASRYGYPEIVKYLLKKGATTESSTNNNEINGAVGTTPLIEACQNGHLEIVKMLMGSGANVYTQKQDGSDCVYMATQQGRLDVLKEVLAKHPDLGERPTFAGQLIIHRAAINGHLEYVKYIIETVKKEILNIKDKRFGRTPLMWAAANDHYEVVQYLIAQDATIEDTEYSGRTALDIAAYFGRLRITKLLINKKADTNNFCKLARQGKNAAQKGTLKEHSAIENYTKILMLTICN